MCFKLLIARENAATQKLHYNSKSRNGCPCDACSVPTVYLKKSKTTQSFCPIVNSGA